MIVDLVKKNLKSGITVAFISIPLSVSLAVASGATPAVGIITAIWAGLVAAAIGGSHFNIVGPTGALSGIVAAYVVVYGAGSLPMLALLAGLMIMVAYLIRLERYLVLIPSSVIHGFTLGVAFIIGLGQLNYALGLKNLPVHEKFLDNLFESASHLSEIAWPTVAVFGVFLVGLLLFRRWLPKLPGAIVLAPVGMILGYFAEQSILPISLQTLGQKFSDISFQLFVAPQWTFSFMMLQTAAVVALIAILETLLSAKIADGMTNTRHDQRKEMLGTGVANIVAGLVGGMPATAALARTSLNIKTGATHRTSALINVVSVLIISFFLLQYFKYIPLAVIAAILVFVAIQMVGGEHFNKLWKYERSGFFVSLLVALLTVTIDPIVGILFGVAISLLIFVDDISRGRFETKANAIGAGMVSPSLDAKHKEIEENADVLLYSFQGNLSFINSRAHLERFGIRFAKYKYVILRMREVHFIDIDGVEAIDEIIDMVEARGQVVLMSGITHTTSGLLIQLSKGYKKLESQGLVFEKTGYALQHLGIPLRSSNN